MTDEELLARFYADNNNQWLGILLKRYTLLLLGISMKYLKNEEAAKDIVQQVFMKVLAETNRFQVESFKAWVAVMARNLCLMHLRAKGNKTVEIKDKMAHIRVEESEERLAHIEKDQKLELMEESMRELSEEQQQCLTLFYLEKRSYQQIVDQTGYALSQVKSHIQNGKRNLKIAIDKKINARKPL